jgi:hypothetical protein
MKLFLIGVGGTGMRCLEAFVHLCAVGMLDGKEINILSLDTDTNNGNKSQSETLIDTYMNIKRDAAGKQTPLKDSFFSAAVNLFRFSPEYSGANKNFTLVSKIGQSADRKVNRQNQDLANLFFDKNVQEFDLAHGYRGQTHIGSYLMYHAILEEVRAVKSGEKPEKAQDLSAFIKKLTDASQAGQAAKVFIFGSIFGGTGASSIPVIPRALQDAMKLRDPNVHAADSMIFGSTLLSNYFTFNKANNQQLATEKVIADADKFSLNSQAALMFYEADATIKQIYQKMYHIGWQGTSNYDENRAGAKVLTGGQEQRNKAHIVELFCAAAAYDFFNDKNIEVGNNKIVYRSIKQEGGKFDFSFADFVGQDEQYKLMNKLTAFYGLCFLLQNAQDGNLKLLAERLASKDNLLDYKGLTEEEARYINQFIKSFGFSYENGELKSGWLHQIQASSTDETFLFKLETYQQEAEKLKKVNWGQLLPTKEHQFEGDGSWLSSAKPFDTFMKKFVKDAPTLKPDSDFESAKTGEKLLNHIYKTFKALHKLSS